MMKSQNISLIFAAIVGVLLARFTSVFSEPLRAEGNGATAFVIDALPVLVGLLIVLASWMKNRS